MNKINKNTLIVIILCLVVVLLALSILRYLDLISLILGGAIGYFVGKNAGNWKWFSKNN